MKISNALRKVIFPEVSWWQGFFVIFFLGNCLLGILKSLLLNFWSILPYQWSWVGLIYALYSFWILVFLTRRAEHETRKTLYIFCWVYLFLSVAYFILQGAYSPIQQMSMMVLNDIFYKF